MGETNDGHARGWVNVAVLSDFGTFGYCWSHIGGTPWQRFLSGLDFDYAMGKMAGRHFMEPMDIDTARDKVRRIAREWRREGSMSKADARALFDAAPQCDERTTFLRDLDEISGGAVWRNELWDSRWEQPSAQARGFWEIIWPLFVASLPTPPKDSENVG